MVHSLNGGVTGYTFPEYCILSLKIDFDFVNSEDPDEMQPSAVCRQGLRS